jgi:hypothetical protein
MQGEARQGKAACAMARAVRCGALQCSAVHGPRTTQPAARDCEQHATVSSAVLSSTIGDGRRHSGCLLQPTVGVLGGPCGSAHVPYPTLPYPTLPYHSVLTRTSGAVRAGGRGQAGRPAQRCPRRWAWARTSRSTRQCLSQKTRGTSARCAARTHVAGKAAARLPRHPCYRAGLRSVRANSTARHCGNTQRVVHAGRPQGIPDSACRRTQSGIDATGY